MNPERSYQKLKATTALIEDLEIQRETASISGDPEGAKELAARIAELRNEAKDTDKDGLPQAEEANSNQPPQTTSPTDNTRGVHSVKKSGPTDTGWQALRAIKDELYHNGD